MLFPSFCGGVFLFRSELQSIPQHSKQRQNSRSKRAVGEELVQIGMIVQQEEYHKGQRAQNQHSHREVAVELLTAAEQVEYHAEHQCGYHKSRHK